MSSSSPEISPGRRAEVANLIGKNSKDAQLRKGPTRQSKLVPTFNSKEYAKMKTLLPTV